MANSNATRSHGTTAVTITLSGEQAQHAADAIRDLAYDGFDGRDKPWLDAGPLTVADLERHVADTNAIADLVLPAMRQLEEQNVTGWSDGFHQAALDARARGEDLWYRDYEPTPPTTGDVTITWTVGAWERVVEELAYQAHGDYSARYPVAAAIREQLESHTPNVIGADQRTVTLSAEHAQFAAAGVRYLLHTDAERATYSTPWTDVEPLTGAALDRHVVSLQAAFDPYRPAIQQLEQQGVMSVWDARRLAYLEACEEAGVDALDPAVEWPPAAPPTTGDVTLTWSTALLELLAEPLTDEDAQKENPDFIPAGEAIRAQLEAAH
jgi:hypothetical protein